MIEWFKKRWQSDRWLSQNGTIQKGILKYDKIEHLLLGFIFGLINIYLALALSVLKEIWDEFVPYQKYGWIGGEGFSFKDLIADLTGIGIAVCLKIFILTSII